MSAHALSIGETDTNTVLILNVQSTTKLNGTNFPSWLVQFNALLIGYDLFGFVDGTKPSPAEDHADYNYWRRQDKLILHAILSSVEASIITMLGNVKNSKAAWDVLNKMFASKTRARIMHLKEQLTRTSKGVKSVSEYLQGIKAIPDELAIINKPIDDDDLVIHALNGLGSEFKEVAAALRTRENAIAFDELHDLLVDYETFLQRDQEPAIIPTAQVAYRGKPTYHKKGSFHNHVNQSVNNRSNPQGHQTRVMCQYCDKPNHTAKVCYKLHGYPPKNGTRPAAHSAMYTPQAAESEWILDSGATHHLTNTLEDLNITNPYHGSDKITIGDGNTLPISHVGKTSLSIQKHTFHLPKVLHVPNISCKLLSVSNLCKTNPISIEFFHDYYLVKDLKTRVPLLKGLHKDGLYYLPRPTIKHKAFLATTQQPWHHILGHPSDRIMRHLFSFHKIKHSINNPCISCNISKSHKLPFTSSSIESTRPLEIIYSDVWGPAPIRSLDGYLYYLIFVDHYSKYTWCSGLENHFHFSYNEVAIDVYLSREGKGKYHENLWFRFGSWLCERKVLAPLASIVLDGNRLGGLGFVCAGLTN
ncbi:Copia polyprotein/retrotransposon [Trifolium repens]|nr:Copia polyprotein/retrotransposon [Trifolium repens]